jgi:hypothetical protein
MPDLKKALRTAVDARDLVALAGLGSLFYGLWQVHEPLAFIVTGSILLILAVRGAKGA